MEWWMAGVARNMRIMVGKTREVLVKHWIRVA